MKKIYLVMSLVVGMSAISEAETIYSDDYTTDKYLQDATLSGNPTLLHRIDRP